MVIGDGDLLQPHGEGLVGQLFGAQASITAVGMAMEVEAAGTAPRANGLQDGGKGMVPVAIAPGLALGGGQRVRSHWLRNQ